MLTFPKFDNVFQPSLEKGIFNTPQNKPAVERTNQYHNFWFYPETMPSNQTKDGRQLQKDEVKEEYGGYTIFFVLMVIIDCVWMLHRMLKAVGVCSLLLYGYPIYVDIRDKTGMTKLQKMYLC